MPLDPSVFAGQLGQPRSAVQYASDFANLDAQRQQAAANALQQAFGQAKLDEYNRQTQQANALQGLYQSLSGKSDADVLQGLRNAGQFGEAAKYEQGVLTRAKTGAETTKEQAAAQKAFGEAQTAALQRYRGALDYIDTPQGAQRWLQAQYADPLLSQHMQALGPPDRALASIPTDPQGFAEWRQRAGMGMEAWMKQQLEQQKAEDTAGYHAALIQTQRRGQDVAANAALQGASIQTDAAGNLYAVPNKVIPGRPVQATPVVDSTGKQVAGAKGNQPLTDSQAKANLFGTRMGEADKILTDLAGQGVTQPSLPQQLTGGQGVTGLIATAMANPQQQQVDQAQRDFINAVLRRESGAAISSSEFDSARKQYFVQPGDSPQVIAQKARNRQTAIQGMMAEVPEGKRGISSAPAPSSGFKYLGKEGQ